jgi:hypothetical protein
MGKEAINLEKKYLLVFFAFFLLIGFYPPTGNAQGTLNTTIYTNADAYVDSSSPDVNYGSSTRLNVTANSIQDYTYFKFDLSSLPPDANIVNATLMTYFYDGGGSVYWSPQDRIGAYMGSDNSWNEQTLTWSNKPAFASAPTDVWGIMIMNYYGYRYWDITSDVKSALQSKSLTEVIKFSTKTGADGWVVFYSKEATNAARIEVEYTTSSSVSPSPVPPASSTPTPVPSITASPTPTITTSPTPTPPPTDTSTPTPSVPAPSPAIETPTPTPTPEVTNAPITPAPQTSTQTPQPHTPTPTPIPPTGTPSPSPSIPELSVLLMPLLGVTLLVALYLRFKGKVIVSK